MYLDQRLLGLLPAQANWRGRSLDQIIRQVRDYVTRLILRTVTHELVHFVQDANGDSLYSRPFLAEAAALVIEQNIWSREEYFQVASGHTELGLSLDMPDADSPCWELIRMGSPLYLAATFKLAHIFSGNRARSLDIERAFLLSDEELYQKKREELEFYYNVAYVSLIFASSLPREVFKSHFGALLRAESEGSVTSEMSGLNALFESWVTQTSQTWWARSDVRDIYNRTSEGVTYCLNEGIYFAALSGANAMMSLRPQVPTGFVYAGDVFYRLQIPFFAFDFYAQANALGRNEGFGEEPEARVLSRIGDSYELLGAIDAAAEAYQKLGRPDEELDSAILIIVLRSKLKEEFYKQILEKKIELDRNLPILMDMYVDILQLGDCGSPDQRERIKRLRELLVRDKETLFKHELIRHFESIRSQIGSDLERGNISKSAESYLRSCHRQVRNR
jgi:hypothetical protein